MQVDVKSYEDIGDYLREVRESLGLDTRDIGQRLNIRAKYLDALEAGHIHVMPGTVYARGYLQHYAEFLGLDKEEIAEAFDRMTAGGGKVNYFVPEPTERHYQPGMLIVGVALLVVVVVYYHWYQNHQIATPPAHERVQPVPERLLDPMMGEQEFIENDALFIEPYYFPIEDLQRDNVSPPPAAEQQAEPQAAPAPADENAPAAETNADTNTETEAAPAAAPARKLPWLGGE